MTYELVCISDQSGDNSILVIRGKKVILDHVLAKRFGVAIKMLHQTVKRDPELFPSDFMFQLTMDEVKALEAKKCRGKHVKSRPLAFTEQGISVLSSVLRSERAIQANIEIMRTFVRLREMLA